MTELSQSIRHWHEDQRPREKMLAMGAGSLTDAELVAILLGSGSRSESAVDLAERILRSVDHNLLELGKLSRSNLEQFKGMGPAKSVTVMAALELGRRRRASEVIQRPKIGGSSDAFEHLIACIGDLHHEEFWVLLLNRANQVIAKKRVSEGGMHATVVDPKRIFSLALEMKAAAIIVGHNHPSGNLSPSAEDVHITSKLYKGGKVLDCPLLDHLIVSQNGYYSFADEQGLNAL